MAKERKDGEYLHCYIKSDLMQELKDYCEDTARNRTAVVEKALREYLDNHKNDKD